jgi:hypothetical protein
MEGEKQTGVLCPSVGTIMPYIGWLIRVPHDIYLSFQHTRQAGNLSKMVQVYENILKYLGALVEGRTAD